MRMQVRIIGKRMLAALLSLAAVAGCRRAHEAEFSVSQAEFQLFAAASGVSEGEDPFNENAINRVKLFFYPSGSDDSVPAKACWTYENVGAKGQYTVPQKRLGADERGHIFGSATECRVIAAVNLPASVSLPDNATVAQVRSAVVTADFRPLLQADFVMFGESTARFVDAYLKSVKGVIPLRRTAAKIRLAASVAEETKGFAPEDVERTTLLSWTPQTDGMRISIVNGVQRGKVWDGEIGREELETENAFYKTAPSRNADQADYVRKMTSNSGIEDYPFWNREPFYSYPYSWKNSPFEERPAYLVVELPWYSQEAGIVYHCYYQIPINLRGGTVQDSEGNRWEIDPNTLSSNLYYLIKLHIDMLGSFDPDEPTELKVFYEIVDWEPEVFEAAIKNNRFLVVNQSEWVMNNVEDVEIPFYSSHEVEIVRVKMHFWNFNAEMRTDYTDDGNTVAVTYPGEPLRRTVSWEIDNDALNSVIEESERRSGTKMYEVSVDNDAFLLHYSHDMIRWIEYTGRGEVAFDYDLRKTLHNPVWRGETAYLLKDENNTMNWSKILVEITIMHKDLYEMDHGNLDKTRFEQTVYITQYPPMYIDPEKNPADGRAPASKGYIFVNKNSDDLPDYASYWQTVRDLSANTNQNPNMYVVTVSQLNEREKDYNIGDPRTLHVNNLLSNQSMRDTSRDYPAWTTAPADEISGSVINQSGGGASYPWRTKPPEYAPALNEPAQRQLRYYYPTDPDKGSFITPRIRIASSYGGVPGTMDSTPARRRCATYQEAGRPAGRWRVPTQGEMQFIAMLSNANRIPMLFSPNPYYVYNDNGNVIGTNYPAYWTAQGLFMVDAADGIIKEVLSPERRVDPAVRCVYDDWYWTREDDILNNWSIFTWGDRDRNQ